MIFASRHLLAGSAAAVLLFAGQASAQLSVPVFTGAQQPDQQQQQRGSSGTAAAGQIAIPPESRTFEPAVISPETPPVAQPGRPAQDENDDTKLKVQAPPSEFENFVSDVVGKPLRRFGSELL
ncbi:MAG: hypothetical protein EOP21_05715, partial [Hyphomicrobiales bacterium]